eukprot:CAMPEP_0168401192 /NCGR_PEP_ID=MMETSP0228-20121227/22981_1 /TAXON_ID=133427 /ORGANISM="Protoceratium reticulatum, Strain CCCM 535 (=CCMP 1889)" /LENGTH=67 /DNA_ID=CAMNT_0008414745 /DNA_START=529 /DNA_END=729 /DNA_ORIENTATION=-
MSCVLTNASLEVVRHVEEVLRLREYMVIRNVYTQYRVLEMVLHCADEAYAQKGSRLARLRPKAASAK